MAEQHGVILESSELPVQTSSPDVTGPTRAKQESPWKGLGLHRLTVRLVRASLPVEYQVEDNTEPPLTAYLFAKSTIGAKMASASPDRVSEDSCVRSK